MDNNLKKDKNLKILLCAFEQFSALKINFHKSEMFYFGDAKNYENIYSQLFGCQIGAYPFSYLGIPVQYKKNLTIKIRKELNNALKKKLSSWKGKLLSVGGRLVFINSVLTSMVLFMLSFFNVPRGVVEKI
jgi:hypothetical protein